MKKIVVKTSINCEKCKKEILKAVTKLQEINQVSVDVEKETVTVVGDVDPVMIVKQVKKAGKCGDIISVGPPESIEKPIECVNLPPCCNDCQLVAVSYASYHGGGSVCNIL